MIAPVTITELPKGEMLIAVGGDGVYVRVSDLQQAGISGPMWNRIVNLARLRTRVPLQGEETIALRLFDPLLRYNFDEAALSLSMTVDPRLFAQTAYDLHVQKPAALQHSKATTTFLTYPAHPPRLTNLAF